MKYTIKKLADLAGISTRTLRYYDEIDLLNPNEVNNNNYRIYNEKNVNKLQQIMFYRSLDFSLLKIKQILDDPEYSELEALQEQQRLLLAKKRQVEALLMNVNKTIKNQQGEVKMDDMEKFSAFKREKILENENKYGEEIRENYGEDNVDKANKVLNNLTKEDYQTMNNIEAKMIDNLVEFKKNPKMDSSLAKTIYQEHKDWLNYTLPKYNKQIHRGLVDMYLADTRFTKYYNERADCDVAKLLRNVVYHYTN